MEEAGVQADANLRWLQVDLGDRDGVLALAGRLRGAVGYVVSLAGYYDFTNKEHLEYVRTNVHGTRNLLDLAREVGAKRFVFASSQAACPFGVTVTEDTPPDADIPYARSKRAGEELVREYSQWLPAVIVRIAAVFSDWCEYPPLYTLLNNWLSGKLLESRILAGRGQSAIPYIHVQDLAQFFLRVLDRHQSLARLCTLNAGPDGAVSHLDLYRLATRFYYNQARTPLCAPVWLLYPMVLVRMVQNHLLGREPFERLWMLKYVDQQLVADSRRSRELLDWKPTPRKTITRRLVFLIENMQRNPELWRSWNEAMLHRTANRPQLVLHERLCAAMDSERDEVVRPVTGALVSAAEGTIPGAGPHPGSLDSQVLTSYVRLLGQLIVTVLRTRNRPMMQQYAHTIAFLPLNAGLSNGLASHTLFLLGDQLIARFRSRPEFQHLAPGADEYVAMTIHMAVDQIEDRLELARLQSPALREELRRLPPPADNTRLEKVVNQLEDLCREAVSGQSWTSPPAED
jgi:nucleoside-diphosphate-sugar epimerase